MLIAFDFNGPNKLDKISFNNIVAMKISTNLDTVRFYQKC